MERYILLLLVSVLLICLLAAIGLQIAEELRWQDSSSRFPNIAVDAPRRSVALLNLLTIPLFLAVVFARRYLISGLLTLIYIGLFSFGVYVRLDGRGFLGGEGFYQDWRTEILAKTHWFEWLLPVILLPILFVHLRIIYRHLNGDANSSVLAIECTK